MGDRIKEIQALTELTDRFSLYADTGRFEEMKDFFSEEAVFQVIEEGKTAGELKGRDNICDAFANVGKMCDTLYHINGQKVFDIDGDSAAGVTYTQITQRFKRDGKVIQMAQSLRYHNRYAKEDGAWKITSMENVVILREEKEM